MDPQPPQSVPRPTPGSDAGAIKGEEGRIESIDVEALDTRGDISVAMGNDIAESPSLYYVKQLEDMSHKCQTYEQLVLKITAELQQKRAYWERRLKEIDTASQEKLMALKSNLESSTEQKEEAVHEAHELQMRLDNAFVQIGDLNKKMQNEVDEKAALLEANMAMKQVLEDAQTQQEALRSDLKQQKEARAAEKSMLHNTHVESQQELEELRAVSASQDLEFEMKAELWMREKETWVKEKAAMMEDNDGLKRQLSDTRTQLKQEREIWLADKASWLAEKAVLIESNTKAKEEIHVANAELSQTTTLKSDSDRKEALWVSQKAALLAAGEEMKQKLDEANKQLDRQIADAQIQIDEKSIELQTGTTAWAEEKMAMEKAGLEMEQRVTESKARLLQLIEDVKREMGRKEALWAVEEASLLESNDTWKKQLDSLRAEIVSTATMPWLEEKAMLQAQLEQQQRDLKSLTAELMDLKLSSEDMCATSNNQLGELQAQLACSLDMAQSDLDTTVEVLQEQNAAATSELEKEMKLKVSTMKDEHKVYRDRLVTEHAIEINALRTTLESMRQQISDQEATSIQMQESVASKHKNFQEIVDHATTIGQELRDQMETTSAPSAPETQMNRRMLEVVGTATYDVGLISSETSQLQDRVRELEKELTLSKSSLDELETNKNALDIRVEEMGAIERELHEKLDDHVALELEIVAVDQELRGRISEMEGVESELCEQILEKDGVIEVLTQELESSRSAWVHAEAEKEFLELTISKVEGDLDNAHEKAALAQAEWQKDIDQLVDQLALSQSSLASTEKKVEQARLESRLQEREHRQALADIEHRADAVLTAHVGGATARDMASKREVSLLESQLDAALNALEQHIAVESSREEVYGCEVQRLTTLIKTQDDTVSKHAFKSGACLMRCMLPHLANSDATLSSHLHRWQVHAIEASHKHFLHSVSRENTGKKHIEDFKPPVEIRSQGSYECSDDDSLDFCSAENSPVLTAIDSDPADAPDAWALSPNSNSSSGNRRGTRAAPTSPRREEAQSVTDSTSPAAIKEKHRRRHTSLSPKLSELVGERPRPRGRSVLSVVGTVAR